MGTRLVTVDGADGRICGSCSASTLIVARGTRSRLGVDDESGAPEPHRHEQPEGLRRAAAAAVGASCQRSRSRLMKACAYGLPYRAARASVSSVADVGLTRAST